jgi:rhodanese-related sulfurtransferase
MLKEITSEELLLNKKINWPTQLIDIREPYEHEEGHIEGSINIPMGDFLEKLNQLETNKQIIIYCNTGRRSKPVVYMLKKLHNISAYNLEGGYKNFLKIIAK